MDAEAPQKDLEYQGTDPPVPFEQRPVNLAKALRRQPLAFLAPLVVCVTAALAVGVLRQPEYSAESDIGLIRVDANAPGALANFAVASASLAQAYSRVIFADHVVDVIAKDLGTTPATVRNSVTAAPIPDSPVIRVIGRSPNERDAITLSNQASAELIAYVAALNQTTPDADRLLSILTTTDQSLQEVSLRAVEARRAYNTHHTPASRLRLANLEGQASVLRLREQTLRSVYSASLQGQSATSLLQNLSRATSAASDRVSKLEILVLAGVFAGGLAGAALALLRYRRRVSSHLSRT